MAKCSFGWKSSTKLTIQTFRFKSQVTAVLWKHDFDESKTLQWFLLVSYVYKKRKLFVISSLLWHSQMSCFGLNAWLENDDPTHSVSLFSLCVCVQLILHLITNNKCVVLQSVSSNNPISSKFSMGILLYLPLSPLTPPPPLPPLSLSLSFLVHMSMTVQCAINW